MCDNLLLFLFICDISECVSESYYFQRVRPTRNIMHETLPSEWMNGKMTIPHIVLINIRFDFPDLTTFVGSVDITRRASDHLVGKPIDFRKGGYDEKREGKENVYRDFLSIMDERIVAMRC